ncbi:hypothetical protein E6O75_ATG08850 [Venturia nashicola]|uniref:CorA-like transporter domain-containing protein n=1 Tax=Venturia nashicola TaxID=86259 RepID=A0A4Z1P484_9PEZI|nr:hypothetical protein E6O75_ATG08850 [Venturia nashicola]
MASIALPDVFQKSCLNSKSYPSNYTLKSLSTYPTALKVWRKRLQENAADMFLETGSPVDIPYRDLNAAGDLDKRNIFDLAGFDQWLGLQVTNDSVNHGCQLVSATKPDPKCRFVYIYGENSRTHLKITKEMVTKIMTYHQVMPVYVDFISVFGEYSDQRDLRFSGFREQSLMKEAQSGLVVPELGRSGRQFQLCYNLKSASLVKADKAAPTTNEWSIRQAAIHHQFDIIYGTTLWIVTKGHLDLQQRFKELTVREGRPEDILSFDTPEDCFRSSLAAHLIYCHWSTDDWRGYIRWLEMVIEHETAMAVYGPRGHGHAFEQYNPQHIQDIQRRQDKINEIAMVLEANVDVMKSLCKFYTDLKSNRHFPQYLKESCDEDILTFTAQVEDMIYDLKMQIARATVLVKITNDRKEIILQHLQSQATARMERLSANMEKEAIVMRIITIVTLIYLPATFVSVCPIQLLAVIMANKAQTFFSTDIVKYQNQDGGPPGNGNFSRTALNRWLQVTFPLTAATIIFAYTAWWLADKSTVGEEHPKARVQTSQKDVNMAGPSRFLGFLSVNRPVQQLPTHEPKLLP